MKVSKAIEINNLKLKQPIFQVDPDAKIAYALANEALKRHRDLQSNLHYTRPSPLPGETNE